MSPSSDNDKKEEGETMGGIDGKDNTHTHLSRCIQPRQKFLTPHVYIISLSRKTKIII